MILSVRDSSRLSRLTVHAILTILQRQTQPDFGDARPALVR